MDHKFNVRTRITNKTYHEPLEKGIEVASFMYVRNPVMNNVVFLEPWLLRAVQDMILQTYIKEEANVKSK